MDPVELFVTQDEEEHWLVWFPRPLGGMNVLDTFDTLAAAEAFRQEQLDSADFGDSE
jgi:hypothetical protein